MTLNAALTLPAGTVLAGTVRDAAGNVIHPAGTHLTEPLDLASGSILDAGNVLVSLTSVRIMTWPAGVPLPGKLGTTGTVILSGTKLLPRGALLPVGTNVKLPGNATSVQLRVPGANGQGKLWAAAPMLPDGSQAWSMRLLAGADTQAADSRALQSQPQAGNLRLADSHYGVYGPSKIVGGSTRFSVIRTGAADLELLAAGNLSMESLFGVYTAGTSAAATPGSPAGAWYPENGGNLLVKAGGNLTGNVTSKAVGRCT